MNKNIRKFMTTLTAVAVLAGSVFSLQGCGKKEAVEIVPDTVENFTLDFETGDFSFDFDGEAKSFYVRIFANGQLDETMPLAARRVRYRSEQTTYEGVMNLSDLQPGDTFDAYVYTYVKDENGDLFYSYCQPVTGIYKATYKTPAKKFSLNVIDGQAIVNLEDGFFSNQYLDKEPSYKVTLFKGDEEVDSITVAYSDLSIVETETQGMFGQMQTTTTVTGTASFGSVDASGEYFATVQILSTDDVAYYDSAVSEKIPVTEPVVEEPAEEGSDMMMGEGMGFGDGGF